MAGPDLSKLMDMATTRAVNTVAEAIDAGPDPRTQVTDLAHFVLEELCANGFAVVELPRRVDELADDPATYSGPSSVYYVTPDGIESDSGERWHDPAYPEFSKTDLIDAAREALAPIRGEIEELRDFYYGNTREDVEARIVLDRIAKLVYLTEELEARDE